MNTLGLSICTFPRLWIYFYAKTYYYFLFKVTSSRIIRIPRGPRISSVGRPPVGSWTPTTPRWRTLLRVRSTPRRAKIPDGCQSAASSRGASLPKIHQSTPGIYYSVLRKRLNKLAVRHLDGSACYVTEGTTLGAPVSAFNQIGSFANSGDKRHNLTAHRYDHTALRNISLSFDPCTLTCKACQGAHQVLRRTIEGNDVSQDNPPVFVLVDQNFPPNGAGGGGRGMSENCSG